MDESKDCRKLTVAEQLERSGHQQQLVSTLIGYDAENQPLPDDDDGLNPEAECGDEEQAANLEEEEENVIDEEMLRLSDELEEDGGQTAEEIEEQSTTQAGDMEEEEEEEEEEAMEQEEDGKDGGEGDEEETVETKEGDTQDSELKKFHFRKLYLPSPKELQKEMMIAHSEKSIYVYPIQLEDISKDIFKPHLRKCRTYTMRFYKQSEPKRKTTGEPADGDGKIEDPSEVNTGKAEKTETNGEKTSETKVEELTEDESKTTDTIEPAMEETSKDETAGDVVAEVSKDGEQEVEESTEGEALTDTPSMNDELAGEVVGDGSGDDKADVTTEETSKEAYKGYVNMIFEKQTDAAEAIKQLSNFREGVIAQHQEIDARITVVDELNCGRNLREVDSSNSAVYIGHLPKSATEAELKSIFTTAKEIRIVREEDQTMKGYAFAIYETAAEALHAASSVGFPTLDGHTLAVFYYRKALEQVKARRARQPELLTDVERQNLKNRLTVLTDAKFKDSPTCQKEIRSIRDQLNRDYSRKRRIKNTAAFTSYHGNTQSNNPRDASRSARRRSATGSGQNQGDGNSARNKRPRHQNYPPRPPFANYGPQWMGPGPRMGGPPPVMGGPGPRMGGPWFRRGGPRPGMEPGRKPEITDRLFGLAQMHGNHLQGQPPRHVGPPMHQKYSRQGRGRGRRRY